MVVSQPEDVLAPPVMRIGIVPVSNKLTVFKLREQCRLHGIIISGCKDELLKRIAVHDMPDAGDIVLPLEDMGSGNVVTGGRSGSGVIGGRDGGRGHGGGRGRDSGHGRGGGPVNVSYMSINSYFRYYFHNLIVLFLYFLATK